MNPWSGKGAGSSTAAKSSLRHDDTMATGSRYENPSAAGQEKRQFRTTQTQWTSDADQAFASFGQDSHHARHLPLTPQLNPESPLAHAASATDGGNVLALLNAKEAYSETIYGDDLISTSATYTSHRHEMDRQHSLAEQKKQHQQAQPQHVQQQKRLADLLAADDIVEYLTQQRYVDDVYGLPSPLEDLLTQARQEAQQTDNDTPKKAVQRLQMIQQHLLGRSQGNPTIAAATAYEMQGSDWSRFFLNE